MLPLLKETEKENNPCRFHKVQPTSPKLPVKYRQMHTVEVKPYILSNICI